MSGGNFLGKKPLKVTSRGGGLSPEASQSILTTISQGGFTLSNVQIDSGTINNVVIGQDGTGPASFNSIIVGSPGSAQTSCFYAIDPGDSACWLANIGKWSINGNLFVRSTSDLGFLRINSNTISSTNTNGNILLDPNGTGKIVLAGPLQQSTSSGDITFNTDSGVYSLNSGNTIASTSNKDTTISTGIGNIILNPGTTVQQLPINFITTGSNPVITTTLVHNLKVGDTVSVSGTNSTPNIDGEHIVTSIISNNSFAITSSFPVTVIGTVGNVLKYADILLSSSSSVIIPADTNLKLGDSTITSDTLGNLSIVSKEDTIVSPLGNLNLNPIGDVVIPQNTNLQVGNQTISSNGTDITLNTDSGKFIINGDIVVNGDSTKFYTETVVSKDPVITLGGDTNLLLDDQKDRGIEFKWNNGSSPKTGFIGFKRSTGCFTIIPDAVNTNEVFTGSPGCATFGNVTTDTITVNNAATFPIVNTCNINCAGTLTITSTETNIPGNLNVTGNTEVNDLTVNGVLTVTGGVSTTFTTEHINVAGGSSASPGSGANISFINVTSSGIATGTLSVGTADGGIKYIMISSVSSGGEYRLTCPSGRLLDPGSGSTAAKILKFKSAGQGVALAWNDIMQFYMVINGGACVI